LNDRLIRFRSEFDEFRRTVIHEPRGSEVMVGALLCPADDVSCVSGVIFFNNTGYLGMCGHGAMGVAVTLHHLGRVDLGLCRLQTPVGMVEADLRTGSEVAIENVPSFRHRHRVPVEVEGLGPVVGDIAWGGNWFFLVEHAPVAVSHHNIEQLTDVAKRIKHALVQQAITGANGAEIDHVEFFGPPRSEQSNGCNFVLCPGGQFDRSPCGTGTSAKLACLAADGKLRPGQRWIQESIIGSRFIGAYRQGDAGRVIPTIVGTSFICGDTQLLAHADDPFRYGIDLGDVA